jgi:glycine betaine catabolism A
MVSEAVTDVDIGHRPPAPIDAAALVPVLTPGSGYTLPAAAYRDEAVLAWERRHLFADAWVCVGRADELAATGSRRAVDVGDDTVLLVRGDDRRLRGFFNVCRHRGHELAVCGTTSTHRSIHCPYHGWRYGLDGSLISTPRFVAPPEFEPADHGLVRVAVDEWHGWVLLNVGGDAPPVGRFLDGIEEVVAPYEPERLVVGATHRYDIAANWKVVAENYQECFHCPNIHPELCRVSPSTSGENYAGHRGMWVGGWMELMSHAATMSIDGRSGAVPLRNLDGVARRRIEYLGVLPNLLLSLHPDYVMTHRLEPLAPGRTAIECQWLFAPEAIAADGFDPSFAVDFWDLTNRQDWAACEGVQRGLASRGYRQGPFGVDEDAVAEFVRLVAGAYVSGRWERRGSRGGAVTREAPAR